ncbi:hypothetical protein Tco_1377264, partial [Tanacetum coccineum]
VPVHEIIYVDMDKDPNDVVFIQGKAESTKKMKGAMGISLASDSSVQYDSKKVMSNTKGKLDNLRKFGNDEGMRKNIAKYTEGESLSFNENQEDVPLSLLFA